MALHPLIKGEKHNSLFESAFFANAIRILLAILLILALVVKYMLINNLL